MTNYGEYSLPMWTAYKCPEGEHCYCENAIINDQPHLKCCNCHHQKSKALLDHEKAARVAEKATSYAWGSPVKSHVILDATRQRPQTIAPETTWHDKYGAQ